MRLIDLRCDWALQYAAESSQYNPDDYAEVPPRVSRLAGYLMGTSLAVLPCHRSPADWARLADPWHALGEMIARTQAEFPGRLFTNADDAARWRAEPQDFLCWGVVALDGLDSLIREPKDWDRLPGLFDQGVRVFQAVGVGPDLWNRLLELGNVDGPRPILDLAGSTPEVLAAALDWFEVDEERRRRVGLLDSACDVDARGPDVVARLRALGATLGVVPGASVESFRSSLDALAAVPFLGEPGVQGIGVATDYLRTDSVAEELADAESLTSWLAANLPAESAALVIAENARRLLSIAAGAS